MSDESTPKRHEINANCPWCDYYMDESTGLTGEEGRAPSTGDISVCLKCGHVAVFENGEDGLKMLLPSQELLEHLFNQREVVQTVFAATHRDILYPEDKLDG